MTKLVCPYPHPFANHNPNLTQLHSSQLFMSTRLLLGGLVAVIACAWFASSFPDHTNVHAASTTPPNSQDSLVGTFTTVAGPCVLASPPLHSIPSDSKHTESDAASSLVDVECVVAGGPGAKFVSGHKSGSADFTASLTSTPSFVRVIVSNCSHVADVDSKPAMRAWVRMWHLFPVPVQLRLGL
jgi:hypothetical protein